MKNASNPQTFRDLDEHGVFSIQTTWQEVWLVCKLHRWFMMICMSDCFNVNDVSYQYVDTPLRVY